MVSVDIVFPVAPGAAVNGIADHTAALAGALTALQASVRIIAGGLGASMALPASPGVTIVDGWPSGRLSAVRDLIRVIKERAPTAVLLQFEQFAYGRRGYNPSLSHLFEALSRSGSSTVRLLYAHENYVEPTSIKHAIMWSYQRRQFTRLARSADAVFLSTGAWNRPKDFGKTPVSVVPVFSNIPFVGHGRMSARAQLGIPREETLVTWFGSLDADRSRHFWRAARTLAGTSTTFMYVGADAQRARSAFEATGASGIALDSPAALEVSLALSASDLVVAPFGLGANTRRGSLLAALEHGRCVLTTIGPESDQLMRDGAQADAFLAAPSADLAAYDELLRTAVSDNIPRERFEARARRFYVDNFGPQLTAATLLSHLAQR